MAPGLFQMLSKNWKRSVLYLTTTNTALWFTYDYTVTNDIMKTCCRQAAKYGDEKLLNSTARTRHITVILNPVACKRKSKKLYTKWVEPIFHLAGIKVSVIETQSPNQAVDLMKIMSSCDGVAIVGGDGTVHDALNGLLQRQDSEKAARDFPIGILPAGQYNSIARYLHATIKYRNQKEFLAQATMKIVDSITEKHDVLKITPLGKADQEPVYALRDLRYGKYQENFFKISGYSFYQTYIKPSWLRVQSLYSSRFARPEIDSISYTNSCVGCTKCYEKHQLKSSQPITEEEKNVNRRWWGALAPISKTNSAPSEEEKLELELSKRNNPECDKWIDAGDTSKITDFRACMMGDKKVRLSLGYSGELNPSEIMETQDVRLKVATHIDEANARKTSQSDLSINGTGELGESDGSSEANQDKSVRFLIDGQPILAHSVEITTLRKPVTIFTGPPRIG